MSFPSNAVPVNSDPWRDSKFVRLLPRAAAGFAVQRSFLVKCPRTRMPETMNET
jgi:hypothetical protein